MCGRGRAGVRQERTAQYGGRMFVFATTQGFQGDMPSAMRQGSEKIPKVLTHRAAPTAAEDGGLSTHMLHMTRLHAKRPLLV